MGYIHKGCGGEIRWWGIFPVPPKCKKCGKTWNPLVIYGPPRGDMIYDIQPKTPATYANWADKFPFTGLIASLLPNWPRWARILSVVVVIGIVIVIVYFIGGS